MQKGSEGESKIKIYGILILGNCASTRDVPERVQSWCA